MYESFWRMTLSVLSRLGSADTASCAANFSTETMYNGQLMPQRVSVSSVSYNTKRLLADQGEVLDLSSCLLHASVCALRMLAKWQWPARQHP
jgi:hypothetical protein